MPTMHSLIDISKFLNINGYITSLQIGSCRPYLKSLNNIQSLKEHGYLGKELIMLDFDIKYSLSSVGGDFYILFDESRINYDDAQESWKINIEKQVKINDLTDTPHKLCNQCNSDMKLRVAKRGHNFGQYFIGCANFPKCNNIEEI